MHGRDGEPENGIAVGLLDDGRRAWASPSDPDQLKAMVAEELGGRRVTVGAGGALDLGLSRRASNGVIHHSTRGQLVEPDSFSAMRGSFSAARTWSSP